MNQIYPDDALKTLLKIVTGADVHYHLYVNDLVVDDATLLSDFVEQAGDGYAVVTVAAADWLAPTVTAGVAVRTAPAISFTPTTGAWTLYGYYVTDDTDAFLLWGGRFDGAPVTQAIADPLVMVPIVGDQSRFVS
jgi:hypothetical protein